MSVTATSPNTSTGASSADVSNALSSSESAADLQNQFLKLLVAQLNNQDPTNPMDNSQLTSQLAQMSTVSGVQQLNTTLSALVNSSGTSQTLQAASLVGTSVLSAGSTLSYTGTGVTGFGVSYPSAVDAGTATVTDSTGKVVKTIDLGAQPAGVQTVPWDGTDNSGAQLAAGSYSIAIKATAAGASVAAAPLTFQTVVSVAQSTSGVALTLADGSTAALTDVKMFL